MAEGKSQAEQLARELAREALFLPDRWRAWLLAAVSEDLSAADLEQHRHEVLNARMSEAVRILERVAEHQELDQEQRLSLTMREFDASPEKIRENWRARKVADALRGSWQLAKSIAFTNQRLPVAPERQWERGRGLSRKRREATFALSAVAKWLETKPERKQRRDYDRWSKTYNKALKPGQKRVPQREGVHSRWPLPWPEIVTAVEQGRLPGETEKKADGEQGEVLSASAPARTHVFALDPQLRAKRLRTAREARGWTLTQVSKASGLDRSQIGHLEAGRVRQPSFETVAKLAEVLGLSLDDFVTPD